MCIRDRYMEIANWTGSAEPASKVEDMGFAFDLESLEPGGFTPFRLGWSRKETCGRTNGQANTR